MEGRDRVDMFIAGTVGVDVEAVRAFWCDKEGEVEGFDIEIAGTARKGAPGIAAYEFSGGSSTVTDSEGCEVDEIPESSLYSRKRFSTAAVGRVRSQRSFANRVGPLRRPEPIDPGLRC